MEQLKDELKQLWSEISEIRRVLEYLNRYPGNKFYKEKHRQKLRELNRSYKFLKAKVENVGKGSLNKKLKS